LLRSRKFAARRSVGDGWPATIYRILCARIALTMHKPSGLLTHDATQTAKDKWQS